MNATERRARKRTADRRSGFGELMRAVQLALVLLGLIASVNAAASLPRRAWLGIRTQRAEPSADLIVTGVYRGSTAEALGVRVGDHVPPGAERDVWLRPGGTPVAGTSVTFTVVRDGRTLKLAGAAVARPFEVWDGGTVRYGSLPFGGGELRDILVRPSDAKDSIVVFLIPGYNCITLDNSDPEFPYRRLGGALVKAGFAFYRVEKPGMGDSAGGEDCSRIDYLTELDMFRTAYRHLVNDLGYSPQQIVLFGHSMGGLQAPVLAAERPPLGVVVYGTIIRNWADYWHDLDVFQPMLMRDADPVETYRRSERNREVVRRFYLEGQSPAQIVAARPELAAVARDALEWDGGDQVSGRHYRYFQQLPGQDLFAAWAAEKSPVLSIYGASDLEAMFGADQQTIVDVVNHYRPGTATYVEVPGTSHMMRTVGTRDEVRSRFQAGATESGLLFNDAVANVTIDWIRRQLTLRTGMTVK